MALVLQVQKSRNNRLHNYVPSGRAAGRIGVGEVPFDATEQRRDDGYICRAIAASPLQGFTMAQTLAKFNCKWLQGKPMDGRDMVSGAISLVVNTLEADIAYHITLCQNCISITLR